MLRRWLRHTKAASRPTEPFAKPLDLKKTFRMLGDRVRLGVLFKSAPNMLVMTTLSSMIFNL